MPLDVNNALVAEEASKKETSGYIELFEIDLSIFGNNMGMMRFTTSYQDKPGVAVSFGGNLYQSIPIKAEGFEWSGETQAPRPKLSMSTINPITAGLIVSTNNLVGAPVKRIRTFAKFLDDGSTPNSLARFQEDIYKIDRMTKLSQYGVEFELTSVYDQQGQFLPRHKVIKKYCGYIYRKWNGERFIYDEYYPCPYIQEIGEQTNPDEPKKPRKLSPYFDRTNRRTLDPKEDCCNKMISGCQARFERESLPFDGFPGALNDY